MKCVALRLPGSGILVCWSLIIALLLSGLGVLCGLIPALIKKTAEGAEDAEDCLAGAISTLKVAFTFQQ